jgi:hypothetical protein
MLAVGALIDQTVLVILSLFDTGVNVGNLIIWFARCQSHLLLELKIPDNLSRIRDAKLLSMVDEQGL